MPKIIELSGYVGWDITVKGLKEQFPKDNGPVLLKVDSVGGSVFEGNRLYNAILDYPGELKIELGALAASAASYFPLAAGPENIKVRANTTFMAHKAWTFAIGNADDMKAEAEILDGFDRLIAKTYSKITGKGIEETLDEMSNELWLIGGQSVVDAGFAYEIIDDDAEPEHIEDALTKNEVNAMIKEAKNTLREKEISEDLNKWAAALKNQLPEPIKQSNSAPIQSGGKNKQEEFMKLSEILEKNPEAKAEYEKEINAAIAEGVKAIDDEKERVAKILKLSGVQVPENILEAVKDGTTLVDFMEKELENRNNATQKPEVKQDLGKIQDSGQLPKKADKKAQKQASIDAGVKDYVKTGGKRR